MILSINARAFLFSVVMVTSRAGRIRLRVFEVGGEVELFERTVALETPMVMGWVRFFELHRLRIMLFVCEKQKRGGKTKTSNYKFLFL